MEEASKITLQQYPFLAGDGEMAALTRSFNWSATSLGAPDHWPQSLRTAVSIILNSKFPMFLWWGPELICFYNDAYRPSLGENGKHPNILGMPAKEAWIEIWHIIEPLINQVMSGRDSVWHEDALIPIYRNGKIEDVYWTFSYSLVQDDSGQPGGVLVICSETTDKVQGQLNAEKNEKKFRNTVTQAPVGIMILRGPEFIAEMANENYLQQVDMDEASFIGRPLFESLPEIRQAAEPLLNDVFKTGVSFHGNEFPVFINRYGGRQKAYFNFIYQALRDGAGNISGIIVVANEVTSLVEAKQSWLESERHFRDMIMRSPIPMAIFRGPDFIIEMANDEMLRYIWRREAKEVIGKRLLEVFPELNKQKYSKLLRQTVTTATPHREKESLAYVEGNDGIKEFYFDYEYAPLFDAGGTANGVMFTVSDVTEKVAARKKIEESEERLSMAIESTKLGTWDYHIPSGKLTWSQECRNIYAVPEEITIDFDLFSELIYPADAHYAQEEIKKAMDPSGDGDYDIAYRIMRYTDKAVRWIRAQGQVHFDKNKNAERFIGTVVDITDQKKTEAEIARMAAIVESSEDAIISKTLDGIVTSWNAASERMFGYSAIEMIGQPITKIVPIDRISEELDILERIRRGERVNHFETKRVTKDKRLLDISLTISPIKSNDGKILGASKISRDITSQKRIEQALQESELRLRLATEGTRLATWDIDLRQNILIHSPRLAEIFGYGSDYLVNPDQLRNQLHPEDRVNIVGKAYREGMITGVCNYEARIFKTDNTVCWIRTQGKVIFDQNNNPLRMIGTLMDITEEKNVIRSLEESQQRLNTAIGAAELGTWELNLLTDEVIYSSRYLEILGFEQDKQPSHAEIIKRLHPEDTFIRTEAMEKAMKTGFLEMEIRIIQSDDTRWVRSAGRVVYNEKQEPVRILGTLMDVTQTKKAFDLLRESEERFRQLANSMPQLVWTSDPEGNLNYFNQSVYDFSGLSKEEVDRLGWLEIVHPDDREENIKKWTDAIGSGKNFLLEHRFKKHTGEYRWQLSRAVPLQDENGKIQMWVGTSTDIHEMKETEQQKDFFISMASHELKTPITSIKGYVQILLSIYSRGEDSLLKNSLRVIDKQIITLTTLISDLLDLSKIKSGSLQLNKEEFSMDELILEIAEEIKHTQPDYEIAFFPEKESMVFADKGRIGQVLINFLTNAIKYSPNKRTINISKTVSADLVTVSVQDSGIGISKKDQEKIFQRFYRVEGQDEKTFPGFGIGLFIAAEIIQRHDGKIGVESEPGIGSRFYFSIPTNNKLSQ